MNMDNIQLFHSIFFTFLCYHSQMMMKHGFNEKVLLKTQDGKETIQGQLACD